MHIPHTKAQMQLRCVDIPMNLYYGDSDSMSAGHVTLLQNFLTAKGYLRTTPNGHYGPATVSAVKSFQTANGISATGSAGPLTRNSIQRASCGNVPYPSVTPTPSASPVASSIQVTSPSSGDILTGGSGKYNISWISPMPGPYNILLEEPGGAGAGYIASSRNGGTSFSWEIGKVFSSISQSDTTVASGTYRIRLRDTSGSTQNDKISSVFTVTAQPLRIMSVLPTSLANDNRTTGVLYGSGFNSTTRVALDGDMFAQRPNILYISQDSRFIVFSLPTYVSVGTHILNVYNQYGTTEAGVALQVTQTIQ